MIERSCPLTGRWSKGCGFAYAAYFHSTALPDDGSGTPAVDEKGNVILLCANAPLPEHTDLGNRDLPGLSASGSIDDSDQNNLIADDMAFPILTAAALRHRGLALGHDEIAGRACTRS